MKFIFVTGGVVSSLGKGISAACIGRLLKRRGLHIFSIKLDPYLNIDPGTMSPYQHGEVFVTKDGAETDLDLGHYERIINTSLTKESSVTSGKVYQTVLDKERKGEYLGATIQIIPHITNEIKKRLYDGFNAKGDTDVCIVEIGGTVGDIESLPFFEAIRQMRRELGYENTFFMHNTLVPYLETSGEIKTKPTQHSVKELTSLGIQPDAILLRSKNLVDKASRKKVALFCNVDDEAVISVKDVDIIYEVALNLQKQHLDDLIVKHMNLKCEDTAYMDDYVKLIRKIKNIKKSINIALVGKYVKLHDAYLSVLESLKYAGYVYDLNIDITWVDSEVLESEDANEIFKNVDGIIVPGGFGNRGIEGKIKAIKYAREHNIPFLGLCLGMQLSLIEIARDVIGYKDANSTEFNPETTHKIIDYLPNQYKGIKLGGTMRLGEYDCKIIKNTLAYALYKKEDIRERHRHRYEFNSEYKKDFEDVGVVFSGFNPQTKLCEIIEYPKNSFFIACQFHPEFQSRPLNPHPLFVGFIDAAKKVKLN
ncbi:MAG: CTP synthase [Firmicutes bacterium]|uniref:CTP synthase n=1 Tax=Candidatus Onthovivens merdipullorum TaxID=2840889 RepID=A0A9D9GUJ2_9BACL|nr:CTP synthase [Candidatus Onthovivens merdipullorum]